MPVSKTTSSVKQPPISKTDNRVMLGSVKQRPISKTDNRQILGSKPNSTQKQISATDKSPAPSGTETTTVSTAATQCPCISRGGKYYRISDCEKYYRKYKKYTGCRKRIPHYMGWNYSADGSPEHQLQCGWRPGFIPCPVLNIIMMHRWMKYYGYGYCMPSRCDPCSSCSAKPCTPTCQWTCSRSTPCCYEIFPSKNS